MESGEAYDAGTINVCVEIKDIFVISLFLYYI